MTFQSERSLVRAAPSRLPAWVTVLGLVLLLGELTGGAVLLAEGPSALPKWLGGGPRTVALQVHGAFIGDGATYTTPTGHGKLDMSFETPPLGQGSYSEPGPTVTKTVTLQPGGIVTINIFNGYRGPSLSCSITVDGSVLSRVSVDGMGGRATCRAKVP